MKRIAAEDMWGLALGIALKFGRRHGMIGTDDLAAEGVLRVLQHMRRKRQHTLPITLAATILRRGMLDALRLHDLTARQNRNERLKPNHARTRVTVLSRDALEAGTGRARYGEPETMHEGFALCEVREHLRKLTLMQRRVFRAVFLSPLTPEQAARKMGMKLRTLYVHTHAIRAILRGRTTR